MSQNSCRTAVETIGIVRANGPAGSAVTAPEIRAVAYGRESGDLSTTRDAAPMKHVPRRRYRASSSLGCRTLKTKERHIREFQRPIWRVAVWLTRKAAIGVMRWWAHVCSRA